MGKVLRKQRSVEDETIFGQIKHNMVFQPRGLYKVNTERELVCIAYTMRKLTS